MKMGKSKLMHELEKGMTSSDSVPKPFVSIFDGMALVRKFSCAGLTYNEFADDLLKFAVASSLGSKRINIVFDVYCESPIKNAERGHRSTGALQFKNIVCLSQIKQWGAFLSNGRNKAEMVCRWQSNFYQELLKENSNPRLKGNRKGIIVKGKEFYIPILNTFPIR